MGLFRDSLWRVLAGFHIPVCGFPARPSLHAWCQSNASTPTQELLLAISDFLCSLFSPPSPLSFCPPRLFHSFACFFFFPFLLSHTQRLTAGLRRIAVPTSSLHYIHCSTNSPSQSCLTHILDKPGVSRYIPVPPITQPAFIFTACPRLVGKRTCSN